MIIYLANANYEVTKYKVILKSELPGFREAQGTDTHVQVPVEPTIPVLLGV